VGKQKFGFMYGLVEGICPVYVVSNVGCDGDSILPHTYLHLLFISLQLLQVDVKNMKYLDNYNKKVAQTSAAIDLHCLNDFKYSSKFSPST
jgi:hypothetical protein